MVDLRVCGAESRLPFAQLRSLVRRSIFHLPLVASLFASPILSAWTDQGIIQAKIDHANGALGVWDEAIIKAKVELERLKVQLETFIHQGNTIWAIATQRKIEYQAELIRTFEKERAGTFYMCRRLEISIGNCDDCRKCSLGRDIAE